MDALADASFGSLLKDFRKRQKLSQHDLAEKLGIHRNTIGTWERGDYLPEHKSMVLELAHHLHLQEQETRQLLEASLNALPRYWNIPFQRNPFFSGREDVLAQLHTLLAGAKPGTSARSVALCGLGGIGKTQAAVEYAYRSFQAYIAVFWLSAETPASLITSLVALANLLDLPEQREQKQERIVAAALRWLNTHRDWLLIIDNVNQIEAVKPLLPTAREGSLLFTTRLPELSTLALPLLLQPLTREEGISFLRLRASFVSSLAQDMQNVQTADDEIRATMREIVAMLDGLPLALEQAGAYIQKTQCSPADFLQLLQTFPLEILREQETSADHPYSVTRTFTLSFERLLQENPLAAELLTACCFLTSDAIPEELLLAYMPPGVEQDKSTAIGLLRFNAQLKDLLTHAFVCRNVQTRTLTIHRLVQIVICEQWDVFAQRQRAEQVINALSRVFPQLEQLADITVWPGCQRLIAQVFACLSLIERYQILSFEITSLLHRAGCYLHRRGQYQQAEQVLERALSMREQVSGSQSQELIPILTTWGYLYISQGQYYKAEVVHRRTYALCAQMLGSKHLETVRALRKLARVSSELGRFSEAEVLFRRVLDLYQQLSEPFGLDMAEVFTDLGFFFSSQQLDEQAEQYYQRALTIREQITGSGHPDTATVLLNLALVYVKQGRYVESEQLIMQCSKIYHQVLGAEHNYTIGASNHLAWVYLKQKRYQEAEELFLHVLCVLQEEAAPDPGILAAAHHRLGLLYQAQNVLRQAEFHLQQALEIHEKQLGVDHPCVAADLCELAEVYVKQDRLADAQPLYRRAQTLQEQRDG